VPATAPIELFIGDIKDDDEDDDEDDDDDDEGEQPLDSVGVVV